MQLPYRDIALYGAGGDTIGHHILHALLANSSFVVTIIARDSSSTKFPSNTKVVRIPATPSHDDLVKAFKGQEVLISALGFPILLSQPQLIDAAIEAGVKRFIPSDYGMDNTDPAMRKMNPVFESKGMVMDYLKSKEGTGLTWTSVLTGLWLDWALRPDVSFLGINISTRTAHLIDGGNHSLSFSTLPYAAQAVAQVLMHPELTANRLVPLRAFEASPRDVLRLLEETQDVKYDVANVKSKDMVGDGEKVREATGGAKELEAILASVRVGVLAEGYPNNLIVRFGHKVMKLGGELGLEELKIEDIVKEAVER